MTSTRAIDWAAPVHRADTGSVLTFKVTFGDGLRRFHGFEDPLELKRGWLYYNDDGMPFKGAPPIANRSAAES